MANWEDHLKKYDRCVNPVAKITIGERKWKEAFVSCVDVSTSVWSRAGTCAIECLVPPPVIKRKKMSITADNSKIKLGAKLEVELGYKVGGDDKTSTVFEGYIMSCEYEITENKTVIIRIYGMDALMYTMNNRKTRLIKNKKKISDVAKAIYKDSATKFSGKKIKISSEAQFKTPFYQNNESDYECLCRLANRAGALFFVDRGKFYFINPGANKSHALKITPSDGILNLNVKTGVGGIPKSVKVIAQDPNDPGKTIFGKATAPGEAIGGGQAPASVTKNIDSDDNITINDDTALSAEEAKSLAAAQYNILSFTAVQGKLTGAGNPELKLGSGLQTKGFGPGMDATAIITGMNHHYNATDKLYHIDILFGANTIPRATPLGLI